MLCPKSQACFGTPPLVNKWEVLGLGPNAIFPHDISTVLRTLIILHIILIKCALLQTWMCSNFSTSHAAVYFFQMEKKCAEDVKNAT